jgi:hypothetical protein
LIGDVSFRAVASDILSAFNPDAPGISSNSNRIRLTHIENDRDPVPHPVGKHPSIGELLDHQNIRLNLHVAHHLRAGWRLHSTAGVSETGLRSRLGPGSGPSRRWRLDPSTFAEWLHSTWLGHRLRVAVLMVGDLGGFRLYLVFIHQPEVDESFREQ